MDHVFRLQAEARRDDGAAGRTMADLVAGFLQLSASPAFSKIAPQTPPPF
jgi:hypothetical protein